MREKERESERERDIRCLEFVVCFVSSRFLSAIFLLFFMGVLLKKVSKFHVEQFYTVKAGNTQCTFPEIARRHHHFERTYVVSDR